MSEADPYTYPGSTVLRNRLGLTDAVRLDRLERQLVTQRAAEGIPAGGFDLAHLRAIHRHLFQDVYDWAGELRMWRLPRAGINSSFAGSSKPGCRTFTSALPAPPSCMA